MRPDRSSPSRRFRANRTAVGGAIVLALLLLACASTLRWSSAAMREASFSAVRKPPSPEFPLGTDALGRSLLARCLYGGALSLGLGTLAAGVAVLIGTAYGAISGYVGGRCDEFMMRTVDVLYALPSVLLVMLLTLTLGSRPGSSGPDAADAAWLDPEWSRFSVLALAIGAVSWLSLARVVRGQVLSIRRLAYVDAARVAGLSHARIILRHILPNTFGPIVVFATLTVPQAILQESFLSFLGVGVQPPQATWGSLAADGVRQLNPVEFDWWLLLFPCAALSVTLLGLNFVGDGLRDAFDVRDAADA